MNHSNAPARGGFCLFGTLVLLLAGCGGGGGNSQPPQNPPPVVNSPPTASAGADQLVLTGAAVSLSGSGSDTDGSIASLAWTQTSGVAVTLNGASTGTPGFTAPASAGELQFQLTVTDNGGLARSDTVTVNVNAPPVAAAGVDQAVTSGANVALAGSGTDTNGNIASYAWSQTGGTAVTLAGANTATPSFTAPANAGTLEFQLTVTDNQGASHSDLVSVLVNALAAPVIAFNPVSITTFEDGNALLFVVASGENLSYEWHYTSGVVAHTSTEPYMLRNSVSNNHCYYVVVSNAAGSATSESACIDYIPAEGIFDPSDDLIGDDLSVASGWGNSLLDIARLAAGGLTYAAPHRSGVPAILGPANDCVLGSSFDGHALTAPLTLPAGKHSVAYGFNHCSTGGEDEPTEQVGAVRIDYDFPNEFGVGSYTMYLSGFGYDTNVMSGVLHVTTARGTSASGWPEDEIEILIDTEFTAGQFNANSHFTQSIELTRRLKMDNATITDATLEFDVPLEIFDEHGYAGTAYEKESDIPDLQLHNPPEPEEGQEAETPTAEGEILVGFNGNNDTYTLGHIRPFWGGGADWRYSAVEPEPPPHPVDE